MQFLGVSTKGHCFTKIVSGTGNPGVSSTLKHTTRPHQVLECHIFSSKGALAHTESACVHLSPDAERPQPRRWSLLKFSLCSCGSCWRSSSSALWMLTAWRNLSLAHLRSEYNSVIFVQFLHCSKSRNNCHAPCQNSIKKNK